MPPPPQDLRRKGKEGLKRLIPIHSQGLECSRGFCCCCCCGCQAWGREGAKGVPSSPGQSTRDVL